MKVTILDVYRDIATVRVECVHFIDDLQLIRLDGRWQIINVLWLPNLKERKEIAVDPAVLSACADDYELRPGFIITIAAEGGRLFAESTGQPRTEIYPESETDFFMKFADVQFSFIKDGHGNVTRLILHQGGRETPAKKIK